MLAMPDQTRTERKMMRLTRAEQHLLNKGELRGGMNAVFSLMRRRVLEMYAERMDELDRAGEPIPMLALDIDERQRMLREAFLDALDMPALEGE